MDDSFVHIGAGETFASVISHLEKGLAAVLEQEGKSLRVLLRILKALGTPQLRNASTIGGTILWNNPASDILPLLRVCGAQLLITGVCEATRELEVREAFSTTAGIRPGDIITTIKIPKTSHAQVVYFEKQARRKTAELAVANIAIFAENNDGHLKAVKISLGGVSAAFKSCEDQAVPSATRLSSLLENTLNPSRQQIKEAILEDMGDAGNKNNYRAELFTCLVQKFISSVVSDNELQVPTDPFTAHQLFQKADPAIKDTDPVTRPTAHISAAAQCTGEARYIDDFPGGSQELHLYPVQSTVAHATFRVDVQLALNHPGVVAWISAQDIPKEGRNLWHTGAAPGEESDDVVFPASETEHFGQIIGLIAAKTKAEAKAAAKLVQVHYLKRLKAVVTVEQSIETGTETILTPNHEPLKMARLQDKEQEKEDCFSLTGSISLAGQEHYYLEPHSALVIPSGEKQELTVHFASQGTSGLQSNIASVLGVPEHKVIVKCKRAGGAFGGKERCAVAIMAAVAANKLGRPCRLILEREVDVAITGHRHETKASYSFSFTKDGKISHSNVTCNYNAGFSRDLSLMWGNVLLSRLDGGYTLKNFSGEAIPRKTNLASNTAFRGFGGPEATLIVEDIIERIANQVDKDPMEVRKMNMTQKGDLLHHGTRKVQDDNLQRCFEECLKMSNYQEERIKIIAFNADPKNKSKRRGIAIMPTKFAPCVPLKTFNQGSAYVRIYKDGSILVSHGGTEAGQGLHTKMLQVAAKVLEVGMDRFHIFDTSTEITANTSPTAGSTGADINGHAVRIACEKLKSHLDAEQEDPKLEWTSLIEKAYINKAQLAEFGFYNTSKLDVTKGETYNYLTNGAGCTVVEVDCLTGNHTVLRTDIVMDVGQSLNPAIDIGQIEGAFIQGNYSFSELGPHNTAATM